jgi:endogenous inhibitor of DNA gyrase (YacG/DUF329 family)
LTGVRIHKVVKCPYCGKQYSVTYIQRHMYRAHR